ncbi:MAG: glycosyltransferase [Alphaproteobacteria bacterium]
MPVRHYGIFLGYSPLADLRSEGLARHLAAFLRAAEKHEDIQWTVACPLWLKKKLRHLCESEGIDPDRFVIVTPAGRPVLLDLITALRHGPRTLIDAASKLRRKLGFRPKGFAPSGAAAHGLARIRHWPALLALLLALSPLLALALAVAALIGLASVIALAAIRLARGRFQPPPIKQILHSFLGRMPNLPGAPRLFQAALNSEIALLAARANRLGHVKAWYCPAAFWPAFNTIAAPRLICVPDVVTADFAVGFAHATGDSFLESVRNIEAAIRGGSHFTTYSETVKWSTLVEHYYVDPAKVHVVPHAPFTLDSWITVTGLPDAAAASRNYCEARLLQAMRKSNNAAYARNFGNGSVSFIFYASQFRPNKNIFSLLRAYEHLLRRRYIGHKLILTGNPYSMPEVAAFIHDRHLENDVLCLHDLTVPELAACYRLAELAVNPSLSEGGCPFTFTEALSVDTPAVMARIPVTLEMLDDPALEAAGTFFDPYDWRDMANRIEAGLKNRQALLAAQKPVYERLARRGWTDVVDSHIEILDRISATETKGAA